MREPLASLARADLFIISRSNQVDLATLELVEAALHEHAPDAAVLRAALEPEALVHLDGRVEDAGALGYHCVLPVCGIGNPATFLRSVEQLAGRVCEGLVFRDHQRYTYNRVNAIAATAQCRGADLVVTTRKDWVKLAPLWPAAGVGPALARLDVRLELQDEAGVFDEQLQHALERTE